MDIGTATGSRSLDAGSGSVQLLQLRVLHLGFLQDGDVGVCVFPVVSVNAWLPLEDQFQRAPRH